MRAVEDLKPYEVVTKDVVLDCFGGGLTKNVG